MRKLARIRAPKRPIHKERYRLIDRSVNIFEFTTAMTSLPAWMIAMGFVYTRNSAKRVLQSDGTYLALSANQFGTSHDPVTVLYEYLSEPAATNVITYSTDFSQSAHTKSAVDLSAGGSSPFGENTATAVTPTTADAVHYIMPASASFSFGSGVETTRYWIVKANGYRYVGIGRNTTDGANLTVFDLNTGTRTQGGTDYSSSNSGILSLTNGWYLIYCNKSTTSASIRSPRLYVLGNSVPSPVTALTANFAGDGTSGILLCHCQQETGARATSPIVTTGATASRSADVLTIPVAKISGFNSAGYTLFVDARTDMTDSTLRYALSLSDTTANNYAAISRTAAGLMGTDIVSGGVSQVAIAESSLSTTRAKTAFSCQANNFLRAINGTAGTSDVSGTMPASPTTLYIGSLNGASQRNGYLFRIALITKSLTQAQVTALTS